MKKIAVLLSTYNGEKWLSELLGSLRSQSYADFDLIFRDDGSNDSSVELVMAIFPEVLICQHYSKQNLGAEKSYSHLLTHSSEYQITALCDQDDVWFPQKIERALQLFDGGAQPTLVVGKVKLTHKNALKTWPKEDINVKTSRLIFENPSPGCTYFMNQSACNFLNEFELPDKSSHDEWYISALSIAGKIIVDENPTTYYRLHTQNDIGIARLQGQGIKNRTWDRFIWLTSQKKKYEEKIKQLQKIADFFLNRTLPRFYSKDEVNWRKVLIARVRYRSKLRDEFFLRLVILIWWLA